MKRFYFGNDEGGDDEDGDEFEPPLPTEFISMAQIDSPWRHMLDSAIRICERSLTWRFKSSASKIEEIRNVMEGITDMHEEYQQDADI